MGPPFFLPSSLSFPGSGKMAKAEQGWEMGKGKVGTKNMQGLGSTVTHKTCV